MQAGGHFSLIIAIFKKKINGGKPFKICKNQSKLKHNESRSSSVWSNVASDDKLHINFAWPNHQWHGKV